MRILKRKEQNRQTIQVFQSLEFIWLMEIHGHTAHIHEYEFRRKIHEFRAYEFESHEYPMNMNFRSMNEFKHEPKFHEYEHEYRSQLMNHDE